MDVRFCPRCGRQRVEAFAFCEGCGLRFEPEPASAQVEPANVAPDVVADSAAAPENPSTEMVPTDLAPEPSEDVTGPPAPSAHRDRRRLALAIVAGVLAVAVVGVGFAYANASSTLASTRSTLTSTRTELTSEQQSLTSTKSALTQEKTAHQADKARADNLTAQVSSLQTKLAARDQCISSLLSIQQTLQKIHREQITNYNRAAKGSVWAKANDQRNTEVAAAVDAYYQAYRNAFLGAYAAANNSVAAGNTHLANAAAQVKIMSTEISKMDAGTTKIEGELSQVALDITAAGQQCGATQY